MDMFLSIYAIHCCVFTIVNRVGLIGLKESDYLASILNNDSVPTAQYINPA